MNKNERALVEGAQAMQQRFTIQTRNQLKVTNRLTAQRTELDALCVELLVALEEFVGVADMNHYRDRLEAARKADPDGANEE